MLAIDFTDYVSVRDWLGKGRRAILIEIVRTAGSTPREAGAAMAVTDDSIAGTIGGGQLEFLAMAEARRLLDAGEERREMSVPLGPEIGQCCGGRVELSLRLIDAPLLAEMERSASIRTTKLPQVWVFGAGHTGRALVQALAALPLRTTLVDSRPETLAGIDSSVATMAAAVPESAVDGAARGAAFVAMTHEHSLDFLITAQALKRGDAAYCGMIGSATKRKVFESWLEDNGYDRAIADVLTCPIGGSDVRDKRPQVIAVLAAAEIIRAFHMAGQFSISQGAP